MITIDPRAGTVGPWFWCRVCGAPAFTWIRERPNFARCVKHARSDACCIEGCTRSRLIGEGQIPRVDDWFCAEHWRRFCPPRSARRRAYHAYFRKAKRFGWSDELVRKYWAFWGTLVASARARAAVGGSIDMAEIERMFGP